MYKKAKPRRKMKKSVSRKFAIDLICLSNGVTKKQKTKMKTEIHVFAVCSFLFLFGTWETLCIFQLSTPSFNFN